MHISVKFTLEEVLIYSIICVVFNRFTKTGKVCDSGFGRQITKELCGYVSTDTFWLSQRSCPHGRGCLYAV